MEKQFVTYEIALKLKELGFDEECFAIFFRTILNNGRTVNYISDDWESPFYKNRTNSESNSVDIVSAPIWQQVIDWFREKHNMSIWYRQVDNDWKKLLLKQAEKRNDNNFNINSFKYEFDILKDGEYIYSGMYSTYKEAREQAILKCIELCQK